MAGRTIVAGAKTECSEKGDDAETHFDDVMVIRDLVRTDSM